MPDRDDAADWNTRYRPERFEEVFGQHKVAAFIGGLVANGKKRDHLLLYGDVGSGKTSLARIYARALNCRAPDPISGSPCLTCDHCVGGITNLAEYDVPLLGDGAMAVAQFLRNRADRGTEGFPHVVFFDEAHALSKKAADYVLKRLEDAPTSPGPSAYVFATTDPERLSPALKSRLKPLHISELSLALAYELLGSVAEQEGIDVEAGALNLVVRYAGRQPRDLISAMQVATNEKNKVLTVHDAKEMFGYDQVDDLEDYFLALARGDVAELSRIFADWRLPVLDKVDWIEAYLTSFYLRTIRGLDVGVDPVVDSLTDKRKEVASAFLDRFGLRDIGELAQTWRAMMQFWVEPMSRAADATLRVAVFHDKSSQGDWVSPRPEVPVTHAPLRLQPALDTHTQGYLTAHDVQNILNGASFLVQRSGNYFNLLLEITPRQRDAGHAEESVRQIDAIVEELAQVLQSRAAPRDRNLAAIRVAENTTDGPLGYLAVVVPPPAHPDDAEQSPQAAVAAWLAGRVDVARVGRRSKRASPSASHWRIVRDLMAGFVDDPAPQPALRELLQIETARQPGLLRATPVRFWGDTAPVPDPAVPPHERQLVSKFDLGRFSELYDDWERLEFSRWSLSTSRNAP